MPFEKTDGMIRHTRLNNDAGRGDWYARLDYGVDVHWGAYPPTS